MKGKTFPKKIKCIETGIEYNSMNELICKTKTGCIECLKKAINAHRKYHGYTYEFV